MLHVWVFSLLFLGLLVVIVWLWLRDSLFVVGYFVCLLLFAGVSWFVLHMVWVVRVGCCLVLVLGVFNGGCFLCLSWFGS